MNLKFHLWLLITVLLTTVSSASAQQSEKIPRVGFLVAGSPSTIAPRLDAFRLGLRGLGYTEGKNILFEFRYAEGKVDRMPDLAAQLVRLKVEIIFSTGPQSTRAAKQSTSTIPIVMAFDNDPVGNGFVASLARPGRNITGLSTLAPEISGKQLELLKEIVPKLSRIAVFGTSTQPGSTQALKELELAAEALGVKLQFLEILGPHDVESAFGAAAKGRAEALLVLNSPVFNAQRTQIIDLAAKNRLPTIYWAPEFVEAGGLMTYGVSFSDLYRRAAVYVDKILKGATPADLPVEQPKKFELLINLKAAKQIGLTIAPNVLARADRVIR
jgi:putative ABC transport system substrate-binding protein